MTPLHCYYHPDYEYPLPEKHPFPMQKFRLAAELTSNSSGSDYLKITPPAPITDATVEQVHTPEYVNGLQSVQLDPAHQKRIGLPLRPKELYERSKLEVSGTVAATMKAYSTGLAFNLAGGTYHAYPGAGSGYCVLNDVAISTQHLRHEFGQPELQVMVIDTDAHQGNGTHAIYEHDPNVFTYDIHVGKNFPSQKETGSLDVPLERWVSGETYLNHLQATLPAALERFEPDFIFWITGADPHICDRFGQMDLTTSDMDIRNQEVMRYILKSSAPAVVLFGGGYHSFPDETGTLHSRAVLAAAAEFYAHHGLHNESTNINAALNQPELQVIEKLVPRIGKPQVTSKSCAS